MYPKQLLLEILRGLQDQHDHDSLKQDDDYKNMTASLLHAGFNETDCPLYSPSVEYGFACKDDMAAVNDSRCHIYFTDGRSYEKKLGDCFKETYYDECTVEQLPHDLIKEAMCNDMKYVGELVWDLCTTQEAHQDTGAIIVGGRWVLRNKGDAQKPKDRGRWVATEVNYEHDMAFSAATPPLEAKRLLFSKYAQRRLHQPDLELSSLDVTKAYFHAEPKRKIYVRVPKEIGMPSCTVGRLKRCCDGTRDAGMRRENLYADAWTWGIAGGLQDAIHHRAGTN